MIKHYSTFLASGDEAEIRNQAVGLQIRKKLGTEVESFE